MIRTYFSFFRMRFLALLQYRAAAVAGMMTNWAFGMMRVMVMCAFYASANRGQPLSLEQSITYIWIGQMLLGILPWNVDKDISNSVITGQVAYELTRPIDIYGMWFMRTLAYRIASTLMRAVPQAVVALWLVPKGYRMMLPTPASLGAFAIALTCAVILSVSITSLEHAYVLLIQRVDGLTRMTNALSELLSGMIIPLALMPDFLAFFLRWQPFAGVIDLPAQLYCGSMAPGQVWSVLAMQLIWAAVFIAAGKALTNYALRRTVLAGG